MFEAHLLCVGLAILVVVEARGYMQGRGGELNRQLNIIHTTAGQDTSMGSWARVFISTTAFSCERLQLVQWSNAETYGWVLAQGHALHADECMIHTVVTGLYPRSPGE